LTSHQLRRWTFGAIALAVALGLTWHLVHKAPETRQRPGAGVAPVRVAVAERRDMAVVEHSLGTVLANTTVQLAARVQGTLERAYFQEGQFVKSGELLFQIDPRPFQTAVAQAKAIYERDQAQLKNAVRDKDRYLALNGDGAISAQLRDTAQTNTEVMAATVAADKAALEMAQLNLGFTQIRAPIDGKTGPLLVQPGNMVAASGATALVTITQVRPVKVSFTLPQSDLPRIQARQATQGLTASIDALGPSGKALTAPVSFTSNAVNAQSGTIELRASFANDDLALVPGALLNITVQLGDIPDAVVVPRDAVNDGPEGSYVYLVKGGKALQRTVQVLFDDTKNVAIAGEVAAGDQVIVEGQLRVIPDGQVTILGPGGTGARNGAAAPGATGKRPGKRP
jgi:membrane fusion protein, multidrug efflux system